MHQIQMPHQPSQKIHNQQLGLFFNINHFYISGFFSDSETASSSKTSTTDAQTLMEEILAEKKRKAQERQKATLEELKKAAQDAAKDAVQGYFIIFTTDINIQLYANIESSEIQNSNKIREEAGPALPPAENGASEPPEGDQPLPVVSKRSDRRASFVLRKGNVVRKSFIV